MGQTMSQALSLRKLADFMQGTTNLSHHPVCLLGKSYGSVDGDSEVLDSESLEALLVDFRSRIWLTYRKDFPSLGPSMLTSDTGWGCTIRSGQMLLAEALNRLAVGRSWSRQPSSMGAVQPVVELFLDHPDAPFSIHNVCAAGVAAGIVAGRWVGPSMLCKGFEALFAGLGEQRARGLRLHVACGSGGGAPELDVASLRAQQRATPSAPGGPPSAAAAAEQPGSAEQQQQQLNSATAEQPAGCCAPSAGGCCGAHAGGGAGQGSQGPDPGGLCGQATEPPAPLGQPGCCSPDAGAAAAAPTACARHAAEPRPDACLHAEAGPADHSAPARVAAQQQETATAPGAGGCGAAERTSMEQGEQPVVGSGEGGAAVSNGHVCAAALEEPGARGQACDERSVADGAAGPSGRPAPASPLLILVPLTLGMDKVNPLYVPQLQQVLSWPQSVGIVGGRPSASLYLCGVQDAAFLYLDPHEAQPAVRPPAGGPGGCGAAGAPAGGHTGETGAASAGAGTGAGAAAALQPAALATYFCDVVRLLPASALDPSMAIGFLCTGPADLEDLFSRLDDLARDHSAAPLMTLAAGEGRAAAGGTLGEEDFKEQEDERGKRGRGGGGGAQAGRGKPPQQLDEWELL